MKEFSQNLYNNFFCPFLRHIITVPNCSVLHGSVLQFESFKLRNSYVRTKPHNTIPYRTSLTYVTEYRMTHTVKHNNIR